MRLFVLLLTALALFDRTFAAERPPNIVLILADDLGYGDLGCFGARDIRTPNIDGLARAGMKFTDFYVSQAVCSASRASLLTGCYANRVGLQGALNHTSPAGINPDELLLSELCKSRGYATAIYGKWHLGLPPYFSPLRHGFDEWLGLPYSNDNSKYHPVLAAEMPPLPLYDGENVAETDPDQSQFTRRFTERAVRFIERNKERPFFLYVPHVMPHVPIFAAVKFRGKSARGLYGDAVEELDWSVGEILAALAQHHLEQNTLVIFSSDNGPFLSYGAHAGSAGPFREGKLTAYEGGVRMPCVMRWPGTIPTGSECREPVMTIDLLPTIAKCLNAELPQEKIDGLDLGPLLRGEKNAKSPHEALFIYSGDELHAVRCGDWKLHLPHPFLTVLGEPGRDGKPSGWGHLEPQSIEQSGVGGIASRHGYRVEQQPLALYQLRQDPGEQHNVADAHPEIVTRLTALAEQARIDLGDNLTGRPGTGVRAAGRRE
jgi:arylsulfatase